MRAVDHNPLEAGSTHGGIFCKEPEVLAGSTSREHLIKSVRPHLSPAQISSHIHCNVSQAFRPPVTR